MDNKIKTPIDTLLDKTVMKCVICGKSSCDCWTKCKCGWSYETGKECSNPDCTEKE